MTDQTSETTPDGLDVAAIRERVEAATEGPWEASLVGIDPVEDEYVVQTEAVADVVCRLDRAGEFIERPMAPARADAEFIAHARTDVELLLAALDEARAEADTHREVAESMTGLWEQEKDRADRLEGMADRLADRRANHEPWHCCCAEGSHAGQAAALNRMKAALLAAESARDAAEGVVREVRALAEEAGRSNRHANGYAYVRVVDLLPILDRLAPVTTDATEGEA